MSVESPSSKKDNSDPSIGYVSIQEIQNVMTERLRRLDTELWPARGRVPDREELIEFFATLKLDLFRRAQSNYVEYCRRVPDPALARSKKPPASPAAPETPSESYEARKARLAKWY